MKGLPALRPASFSHKKSRQGSEGEKQCYLYLHGTLQLRTST